MSKGKYLAIDFGDSRVGLAISDYNKQLAFPREFFVYKKKLDLFNKIKDFCESEDIIKIIIGLPIELDGKMGDRVEKTYKFADKLKDFISPLIQIEYLDERLTTKYATSILHEEGVREKNQKGYKDMLSAQIILETYLKRM